MTKFAEIASFRREKDEPVPVARSIKLEPADFADQWLGRPRTAVVVGLRRLSSDDEGLAEKFANDRATEEYPDDEDERAHLFNKTLKAWIVARAICDPNDARRPHPTFPCAEDLVPVALPSATITRLFDAIERFYVETSSLQEPLSDEDLAVLGNLLSLGELSRLPTEKQARARRLLSFVLDELAELAESEPTEREGELPDA